MSNFRSNAPQPVYRHGLRLESACSFAAAREMAQFARDWLASHRVAAAELAAWEFALVEAGNNAVEHASEAKRALPIVFELSVGETEIEARVTDHTPGFDFPEHIDLPDLESEGGRGLFLIKSLTDHAAYLRGQGENQLLLRKRRAAATPFAMLDTLELQRRLAESEIAVNEMSEELASSYESLVAMFRYSAELGTNSDLREFTARLLTDLLQLTESDAAVLRLLQGTTLESFLTLPGDLQRHLPPLELGIASGSIERNALTTREDVWFTSVHALPENDPLSVIAGARFGLAHAFGAGEQLLGTITLVRSHGDGPLRSPQVNLLHTLADFLAIQIVNARLMDEQTQTRITRRELEIAANIQHTLLPVSLPSAPPFELAASCTNAREVGGDFYDALRVGDQGLLLIIADVMGKGVPAALFAAVLRSAVRSMPALFTQPAALLAAVNRTLCEDLSRVDMFVTAAAVYLDLNRQQLVSASAGHCPLLLWQPGQPDAQLFGDAGLPLGIDAGCEYTQTHAAFPAGALALLYTDGVTESQNAEGQMLGAERLAQSVARLSSGKMSAAQMKSSLLTECEDYRQGAPLADDQTFVLLRHDL